MKNAVLVALMTILCVPIVMANDDLATAVAQDYDEHLAELFVYFHSHPELPFREFETSKRLAEELRAAGIDVTEGVGGTGVVGMLHWSWSGPISMGCRSRRTPDSPMHPR